MFGCVSVTTTVVGSGELMDATPARSALFWMVASSLAVCSEVTTSSAVIAVPSWKVTPWRSVKVYVSPSAEIVQSVASSGTIALPSSPLRVTRPWYTLSTSAWSRAAPLVRRMSRLDGSSDSRTFRVAFASGAPVGPGVVDVPVHEVNRSAPRRRALVATAVRRSIAGVSFRKPHGIRVLCCRGVG